MLSDLSLHKVLFLDIETVPETYKFDELPEIKKDLFSKKVRYRIKEGETAEDLYNQAGIWAEFGKIIVISVGYFTQQLEEFRIKSFASKNEVEILKAFSDLLRSKYFNRKDVLLCAHNGKEFDFPYIARRMIINKVSLPEQLKVFGKKPWETSFCDTMELWRFGDYKHYTSLDLLTNILGIASPKGDIEGKDVASVYYENEDLTRIRKYCEQDVLAIAQIILRYMEKDILKPEQIVIQS